MADKEVTLIAAGSTFTVVGKTPYLTATVGDGGAIKLGNAEAARLR